MSQNKSSNPDMSRKRTSKGDLGEKSCAELRIMLKQERGLPEILDAIVDCARDDNDLVDDIAAVAENPKFNVFKLFGVCSIAHIAVVTLFRVGTPPAVAKGLQLVNQWPNPDRILLEHNLKTGGIDVKRL